MRFVPFAREALGFGALVVSVSTCVSNGCHWSVPCTCETFYLGKMARPAGFEPATLGLEDRCSIQLSYGRILRNKRQTIIAR